MALIGVGKAAGKAILLLLLLPKRPLEFYDRLLTVLAVRLERLWVRPIVYEPKEWSEVIWGIEKSLGKEVGPFLDEPASAEITGEVCCRIREHLSQAPFNLTHNADFTLARFCYAVCRAVRPANILETGVAYGVTSAFILKALEVNGYGLLHSVDLPPLGHDAERFVGSLIPDALKHRWRLHRGVSSRVLPSLLPKLCEVDIFIHDSLHTYRNMLWELQTVASYLAPQAIAIADDVDRNQAFQDWVTRAQPAFWATIRGAEKESVFGVSVFHGAHPPRP